MTTKNITSQAVSKLKQLARELKRNSNLTHQQALEQVATEYGFDNWHQVTLANQPFKASEETFKNGIYVLFDVSEAEDMRDVREFDFQRDDLAQFVCRPAIEAATRAAIDEYTGLPLEQALSEEEFEEELENYIDSLVFFKLKIGVMHSGEESQTISIIDTIVSDWNFWLPRAYIINGKFITGGAGAAFYEEEREEEGEHYNKEHWPENQEHIIDNICIDPLLPENFDDLEHKLRSRLEIQHWWGVPFITTHSHSREPVYHVRMLDGGAWDRTTGHGVFDSLDEALSVAKSLRE